MKLSIIIPVYNEKDSILTLIEQVKGTPFEKEIIVVDDCSTDGTRELLQKIEDTGTVVLYHDKNQGKGAAVRTGLEHVTGDVIIFQDADLEYSPSDYPRLVEPIIEGKADVVYGSRYLKKNQWGYRRLYWGNRFLTIITNFLYKASLSDMEVGYKVFRASAIKAINIKSNSFDMEPEITAKMLKKGLQILEVPISYNGRSYDEGKKIHWKDGFRAIYTLVKFRFVN